VRRILDGVYASALALAAACLATLAVLVLAQVIGRALGMLVPAAEELAGYLMAAATFLALAHSLRAGAHIRVTLAIGQLDARTRRWQETFVLVIALPLSAGLAWWCLGLVAESLSYGDTSSGHLAVPLWIPQAPMALGLIVFTIALADELLCTLRHGTARYRDGETGSRAGPARH
jgi:TRAP-type C4-dicarboxylate transport system permease small subunit